MSQAHHDQPPVGLGQFSWTTPTAGWDKRVRRFAVGAVVLGATLLGLGACAVLSPGSAGLPAAGPVVASPSTSTPATAAPKPRATKTAKAKAPPAEGESAISDAQYFVGTEIKTGTWKSSKADDSCYADTQTKAGRVLEQEDGSAGETSTIRIKSSAYTFTSRGCGTWKKVS